MHQAMHNNILSEIDAFLAAHGMAESTFGRESVGDWKLVSDLRGKGRDKPRRLWPETETKVRHFMAGYVPSPKADAA